MSAITHEKLTQKYGFCAEPKKEVSRCTHTHWKDSEPVVMLFAFLKEYNDQGFILQQTKEGKAVLIYEPGLKAQEQDPERWDLAVHVYDLMDKTKEDLNKLIFNGYLTLPEYTGIWL